MRKIIGIGETVLDVIFKNDQPQKAVPGGSTFNALISLGRTVGVRFPDTKITMITETGDDHIGDIIVDFMRKNNLETNGVVRNSGTQTHISMAFLDQNNDAQYEFYKNHAGANMSGIADFSFHKDDIVLFGSFFAINPVIRHVTRRLISEAHNAGAILFYDINFRKSHIKDIPTVLGNIEENCSMSHVVRGSADDFGYLFGSVDPQEIYDKHIKHLCPNFICTRGAESIEVFTADGHYSFDTEIIETVSTIGAGDNFNAGFIYSLIRDNIQSPFAPKAEEWQKIIRTAQKFSSAVCQRIENYVDEGFVAE